jgi:hypothetical protein
MWPKKPTPTQRQPSEDPIAWARKETIAFASWKCKIYGTAFLVGCASVVPFLHGMPANDLAVDRRSDTFNNSISVHRTLVSRGYVSVRIIGSPTPEVSGLVSYIIANRSHSDRPQHLIERPEPHPQ